MGRPDDWRKLLAQPARRRQVLRGAGVVSAGVAVSAFMAACGGNKTSNSGGNTNALPQGAPAASGTQAANQPTIQRGGELVVRRPSAFTFADPQRAQSGYDPLISHLYSQPMLDMDEKGKLIGNLVQSWEQADETTLVFKVRKDMQFSDGTPVNAAAIKYSITRSQGPEFAVRRLLPVKSIDTPDDFTAVLKFDAPNAVFLDNLIMNAPAGAGAVISPTAHQKLGDDGFNEKPVGAGPYILETYGRTGETVLVKNPNWNIPAPNGDKLPYLDKVKVRVVPETATAVADLQAGNIDLDHVYLAENVPAIQGRPDLAAFPNRGAISQAWGIVTNKKPTDALAFRKALNYMTNREELLAAFAPGLGDVGARPLTKLSWAYDESIPTYAFDEKRARELLAQSGVPEGTEVRVATSTTSFYPKLGEMFQAQLARFKLKAVVDALDVPALGERFRTKAEYQLGIEYSGAPQGDPFSFLQGKYATDSNPGRVPASEFDALFARALRTFDQNERKKLYSEIQKMDYEGAHRIWLLESPTLAAAKKKVQGLRWLRVGSAMDLRYVWKEK